MKNICFSYLSLRWIGNPSSNHSIVGGGFPLAIHFRETEGPGWSVCSENLYSKAGMASEIQKNKKFDFKWYATEKNMITRKSFV